VNDGVATVPREDQLTPTRPTAALNRITVRGKFLFDGATKFWIRGVTYGTFAATEEGFHYPPPDVVTRDFAAMAHAGINCVRVYTVPPPWLLDLAAHFGLRIMVGLPWEQHLAFLDQPGLPQRIEKRLGRELGVCIGHPAILCYAVGNEIPATVVRWHGKTRIEAFLGRLAKMVRALDPEALVTYVNFPTTEYLELPFVDFHTFNVYLEQQERLSAYLARLQNLAGEKPLVLAEIGLDSQRNGESTQATVLDWQIRTAFESGCAGAIVFAWTDEWNRGGNDILDWDFGLVTRDRRPKPALETVAAAYREATATSGRWPRISVVVCSYNGGATIAEPLEALTKVDYPDFEVIVVNDGSTDDTPDIASRYDVRLISTPNNGLSHARNLGLHAATGEIVAYTDDDAFPDPDWLKFLALKFMRSDHAGVGGPNLPPMDDNDMAQCVANAPGGPIHVLLDDDLAEHIPGCNMAFRREDLLAIGGFDPLFRIAGDDVDVCWRIQEAGGTLGISAAAMVWHRRRPSLRRYLKQQQGYARAEALLARKWPGKYNMVGHLHWHGRLYGRGLTHALFPHQRIYNGQWGSAPFQSVYAPAAGLLGSLPLMPEWYVLVAVSLAIGALGLSWPPLLFFLGLGLAGLGISLAMAARAAMGAHFHGKRSRWQLRRLKTIVFALHLLQPLSRLVGRAKHGIGPWNSRDKRLTPFPWRRSRSFWSGRWHTPEARLERIIAHLRLAGISSAPGGDFDRWDIAISGSLFGGIRTLAMVEDHGGSVQHFRMRAWPVVPPSLATAVVTAMVLAGGAGIAHAWIAAACLLLGSLVLAMMAFVGCATATAAWLQAFDACATAEQET
jgi:GT2 family glycosyltransferase